jgi:ADP-ribose pyrophosphatase YjhB (NUDIX family)
MNEGGTTKASTPFVLPGRKAFSIWPPLPHGRRRILEGTSRMLRKTTERLLARAIPVLYYIRLAGWRVLRPITVGVRVLVVDGDRLLLVRGHGHDHWHLPGGAIKRGELLADAARREVYEETGCRIEVDRLLGMYSHFKEYKSDHQAIFVAHPLSELSPRLNIEIAEARFFPLSDLPARLHRSVRERLEEYQAQVWAGFGPWDRRDRR